MSVLIQQVGQDRILQSVLSKMCGGGPGIIRNHDYQGAHSYVGDHLLNLNIAPFCGFIDNQVVHSDATELVTFVAPSADSYYGLVQYTLGSGFNVKYGATHASPTVPTVDSHSIAFAKVLLTVGQTEITTGATDTRTYV
jgi:hypothetical protein